MLPSPFAKPALLLAVVPSAFPALNGRNSLISVLAWGFIAGLWHALDADHLAAVSTIVSERRSLLSSSLIGGLWGVGHTLSLLLAGVAVILLQLQISARLSAALEFGVALMLIGLGANVLLKLARGERLHLHTHTHGGRQHIHPHLHAQASEPEANTHHGFRLSKRPLLIGMVHGLAGSGALMVLGVAAIQSIPFKFVYLALFGIGSIGGMMAMSSLLGLPAYFTAARFQRAHFAIQALAGCFSFGFGLFLAYEIGVVGALFR